MLNPKRHTSVDPTSNKLVNNLALLLNIPRGRIKVACVHKVGEPCVASLGSLFGGRRRRAVPSDNATSTGATGPVVWNVDFDIEPPFRLNETGTRTNYDANTDFFETISATLSSFASEPAGKGHRTSRHGYWFNPGRKCTAFY